MLASISTLIYKSKRNPDAEIRLHQGGAIHLTTVSSRSRRTVESKNAVSIREKILTENGTIPFVEIRHDMSILFFVISLRIILTQLEAYVNL